MRANWRAVGWSSAAVRAASRIPLIDLERPGRAGNTGVAALYALSVMPTPFGAQWADLTLADIERFLSGAEEEGLTWEAKADRADQPLRPTTIHKAVCGFGNSEDGGYLLIGIARHENRWVADGLAAPPSPELTSWLDSVIRSGVNPVPAFKIQAWETAKGTPVGALYIPPVTVPPCITASGTVYERTSGRTSPVTDAAQLARLYAQGESARRDAEQRALRCRDQSFNDPPVGDTTRIQVVLAASSTGKPSDIAAVLFTQVFASTIKERLGDRLWPMEHPRLVDRGTLMRQDRVISYNITKDRTQASWAVALWDGSVAVAFWATEWSDMHSLELGEYIPNAWTIAADLLKALGCHGLSHVTLIARHNESQVFAVQRWTDQPAPPNADELSNVYRELRRATGDAAFEPDPAEEPA